MPVDLEADAVATSDADLSAVRRMAERARDLEQDIEAMKARVEESERELADLATKTLPEAMASLRLTTFSLDDGTTVAVKDFLTGGIPSPESIEKAEKRDPMEGAALRERRRGAVAWLRSSGNGALVKNEVKVTLGKGQDGQAEALVRWLEEKRLAFLRQESVHHKTLESFLKEQMSDPKKQETFPVALFGVHQGKKAVFALPPKPGSKKAGR